MLESIRLYFEEVLRTFRWVDVLDILLVAIFLYAGLVWFQRTASRGVLAGVGGLTAVYFLARGLDMYLTSLAFQTSFAVLLLILVVVFQEDLRRLFERVSALENVRFASSANNEFSVDELVLATFKMAGTSTGALMVLRGKESLERHLDAGIRLGGKLSAPLLYSIFDSHSPGHDGAVVIDRNRIEQFSCHLPVSKNAIEIAGRGTRHSAAVGLSECSDALVIVVSEERGVVSVAESGKLVEVPTAADLKWRLANYQEATFPDASQPFWKRTMVQHGFLKVSALLIAILAWLVLAYDPNTIQRTFLVPIEYRNLPNHLVLDERAPAEARVTLSGSERNFRFLDPGTLRVTADLSDAEGGFEEFSVESNLRLPANLTPYRIDPRIIRMLLRERPSTEKNGTAPPRKMGD